MEQLDSKLDLFQSLKDDESNDHEGASQKSMSESEHVGNLKYEPSDDETNLQDHDMDAGSSSPDKELKKKVEKQNRKEIEEEEREKML